MKIILIEDTDDENNEDEVGIRKELIFTNLDSDMINVQLVDEDTSEELDINICKNELIKVLNLLTS